jgi:hypothetical protein
MENSGQLYVPAALSRCPLGGGQTSAGIRTPDRAARNVMIILTNIEVTIIIIPSIYLSLIYL